MILDNVKKSCESTLLVLFIIFSSCDQNNNLKKRELDIKERELAIKEKELNLIENKNDIESISSNEKAISNTLLRSQIINHWLDGIFKVNYSFSEIALNKVEFTFEKYKLPASKELKLKLKELNGFSSLKPKVKIYSKSIKIEFTDDEESLQFFIFEDKFILTGFYGGSSGETWIYNLTSSKMKRSEFTIWDVQNNLATIERDYFDPRGPDDPDYQGHIYKRGVLDFQTNNITWDKE